MIATSPSFSIAVPQKKLDWGRKNRASWLDYALKIAEQRIVNNWTPRNVEEVGIIGEQRGALAEVDQYLRCHLPVELSVNFDGGFDLIWRGLKINIKSTPLLPYSRMKYRHLQWPITNPFHCDIAISVGVDLETGDCIPYGWATIDEVKFAPINFEQKTPCHEIDIPRLHRYEALADYANDCASRHFETRGHYRQFLRAFVDGGCHVLGTGHDGRRV